MTNDYDLMYGEPESVWGRTVARHEHWLVWGIETGLGGVMMVFEEAYWRCG